MCVYKKKALKFLLPIQIGLKTMSLKDARIVVIGAGAAGIAAATKLRESGSESVIVLEAESRIGGRIHTIPFGDNVVDMGAQWCHGEKNNVVYETIKKNNLNLLEKTGNTYYDYKCIRSNKEILSEKIAKQLKSIAFNLVSEGQEELKNYEGSFGSYLTEQFWKKVQNLPEPVDRTIAGEFFENYKKFECSLEASDNLFEVSGKGHLEYWECEGDLLLNWKDKGYISILNLLMRAYEGKPFGVLGQRLFLGHRVKNINWQQLDNTVKITCYNGQVIVADHVICTTSLGVLKESHSTLFTPALPREKILAIEGLNLGTVNKFFLEFREPFGPSNWSGMCFLWQDEDLSFLRKTELFWLEGVFGFYRVSRHQPRVLEGWIIGTHARYMESLTEDEVLKGLLALFNKFFKFSIPTPLRFERSQWYSNENFRGSYSFRSMYTEELGTGSQNLAKPLYDSLVGKTLLQFAGEATHNHYYSTVHGAIESGWREAQRLIDYYAQPRSQL